MTIMGAQPSSSSKTKVTFESQYEDWPWVWGLRDAEWLDWKIGLTNEEIQSEALRQIDLPVPITDNLYLGDARSVETVSRLKDLGITAVLNMAGPVALRRKTIEAYKKHGIQYKRIDAEDEIEYPLLEKHCEEAFDFIEKTTTKDDADGKKAGKCVVHCRAGMNRSGLVAAAYYMMTTQTHVLETVKHVRKQRGNVALSNEGFQQQLVAMARKNNLLGPRPGTEESIIKGVPPPVENDWIFASSIKSNRDLF